MSTFNPVPKPTPRLTERLREQREELDKWRAVCRAVDERDGYRCRVCKRRTIKTLTMCAERAEHHHVTARSVEPSLKWDARNLLLVCLLCHTKLTRHELTIDGPRFLHQGWRYLDASQPLTFVATAR